MKALIYKEFKLSMHPICYIFIFLFPFMILIPSYPLAVGFIYILSCYPVLFLGANKGQQSNDLLFSTLLPVRKKDIVMARIITVAIMQFMFIAMMSCLYPLAYFINQNIPNAETVGMGLEGYVTVLAIVLVGYSIADLIFFPIYYKHGKSIVMSTLFTILGFVVYLGIFTIGFPYIPGCDVFYRDFLGNPSRLWIQFIALGIGLGIYILLHWVVYKVSAKRLEQVDF